MFGGSWWTVGIDNASNAMTTIHAVEVQAIDTNGLAVPMAVSKSTTLRRSIKFSIGPSSRRYRGRSTAVFNSPHPPRWPWRVLRSSEVAENRKRSHKHCGTL
jgi:hypothetical protein